MPTAWCARAASSSADPTVHPSFTTGRNIARWSRVSCSTPRCTSGRRSVDGMSVATTSTGDPDAHASPTAPNVFAAPGPVVTIATPSRPVVRAYPSAA